MMPRDMYQKNILIIARKIKNYEGIAEKFGHSLYENIDKSVLDFVLDNTDRSTINVLCTASPEDYVKYLCGKLGWNCISSSLVGNQFVHMYKENKIIALQKAYPAQSFIYNLAISDDRRDAKLLKLFNKPYLVRNGRLTKSF